MLKVFNLVLPQVLALRMEPLVALVTLDVEHVGVQGLLADAQTLPILEIWQQLPRDGTITSPRKECCA